MNELLKRGVTGIIYIFLLLAAIMLNTDAFDFLFLVFGLICIYEFKKLIRLSNLQVFVAFLILWWLFIHFHIDNFIKFLLLFATIITNIVLTFHLFRKDKVSYNEKEKFIITLLYIGGGSIFIPLIYQNEIRCIYPDFQDYRQMISQIPIEYKLNEAKHTMIAILCIIWASDSFAYLTGKMFGKRKLFPSVSPKKTIEGLVGGFIGALIIAVCFSFFSEKPVWVWILLTFVLVVAGTLGDLLESKFKRMAGKKDSGTILPGHGGLLDRLDSLIFASPFAYLVLQIVHYFS